MVRHLPLWFAPRVLQSVVRQLLSSTAETPATCIPYCHLGNKPVRATPRELDPRCTDTSEASLPALFAAESALFFLAPIRRMPRNGWETPRSLPTSAKETGTSSSEMCCESNLVGRGGPDMQTLLLETVRPFLRESLRMADAVSHKPSKTCQTDPTSKCDTSSIKTPCTR